MKAQINNVARIFGLTLAIVTVGSQLADASSLNNLERERAKLLSHYLDPALAAGDRQSQGEPMLRRLVDLERMVLRDDSLAAKPGSTVKRAFENYDLTFLVHAAAEKKVTVLEVWLRELGVSSATTLAARVGRR